ncbi:hypothetical protein OR233_004430 [Enterobacter asburiae]|nr:hypothetical protein [Enterobacter asburiae]
MNVKMKKIVLACAVMGASAAAVAADFSDPKTANADIVFTRPLTATLMEITPVAGLTTETVPQNTVLAQVRANTVAASTVQMGLRWTSGPDYTQVVNGEVATISEKDVPDYKVNMRIAESPSMPLVRTEARGQVYLVGGPNGRVEADIVKADTAAVQPGTYKVYLDSAIYNP